MTAIRRFAGLAGMLAIVLFFAISLPETFLTARNWLNISQQVSMLAVVAATMTVVMVMGDADQGGDVRAPGEFVGEEGAGVDPGAAAQICAGDILTIQIGRKTVVIIHMKHRPRRHIRSL